MQLPGPGASYIQRVRYGRYVARRVKRAGFERLATDVTRANQQLKAAGRAWEDADEPVQDGLADRDAADDTLDHAAQSARGTLAGRSVTAMREAPYTSIFPDGVGYYTAAPVGDEVARYRELDERLTTHLPAADPVRRSTTQAIHAGLKDYQAAADTLETARRAASLAGTALDRAIENWDRLMEKTYGALVSELGRAAAEAFFPKTRAPRTAAARTAGTSQNTTPGETTAK
jgi:hypothetical protein